MDFKPDITFEYDYIRIVYEFILANLRTNKKIIEKDLLTIVNRIQNLKKKQTNEVGTVVKNLINKINEVEKKVNIINKKYKLSIMKYV